MAMPHYGVVLSTARFNSNFPSVIVAPITSKEREPFKLVRIAVEPLTGTVHGFICLDQIRSIDPTARGLNPTGHSLTPDCLSKCKDVLNKILI